MRKILFRGKEIYTQEWIVEWYIRTSFGSWPLKDAICDSSNAEDGEIRYDQVDPSTISEYTGFRDKLGRPIYEGDICDMNILLYNHSHVVISMRHGAWGFMPLDPDLEHPDDRRWKSFWDDTKQEENCSQYLTIIGNIYDDGISFEDVENKIREFNEGCVDRYED